MATEPMARGTIFRSLRAAAIAEWKSADLDDISARLPEEVRRELLDRTVIVDSVWLPERYVLVWYQAVWGGPCHQQGVAFRRYLCRMVDLGFGRVRKLMLSLLSPHDVAKKAAELWRYDHDTGVYTIVDIAPHQATLVLKDHVYGTTELSRIASGEINRYIVQLCRGVREAELLPSYDAPHNEFRMTVRWK